MLIHLLWTISQIDEHGWCCPYIKGNLDTIMLSHGTLQCGKYERKKISPCFFPGIFLPIHSSREAEFGTSLLCFGSPGSCSLKKMMFPNKGEERQGTKQGIGEKFLLLKSSLRWKVSDS